MRWTNEDTPEQQEFRAGFRTWLPDNLPAGWMEAADAGDDDTLEKLKAGSGFNPFTWQGTIGRSPYAAPLWPEEFGGLSGEVWMQTVIRSELVRYRLPTVSINLLGVGLAGPTLIAHGTQAQKERYLRKILSAEEIWCQLFSEPGSGSDLASLSTRARARRRRVGRERPEGVDHDRPVRQVRDAARPHRTPTSPSTRGSATSSWT